MAKSKDIDAVIIFRPDGLAKSYKVGDKAMNEPGETIFGDVDEIELMSETQDVLITFSNGAQKTYSGMPYVHTYYEA